MLCLLGVALVLVVCGFGLGGPEGELALIYLGTVAVNVLIANLCSQTINELSHRR